MKKDSLADFTSPLKRASIDLIEEEFDLSHLISVIDRAKVSPQHSRYHSNSNKLLNQSSHGDYQTLQNQPILQHQYQQNPQSIQMNLPPKQGRHSSISRSTKTKTTATTTTNTAGISTATGSHRFYYVNNNGQKSSRSANNINSTPNEQIKTDSGVLHSPFTQAFFKHMVLPSQNRKSFSSKKLINPNTDNFLTQQQTSDERMNREVVPSSVAERMLLRPKDTTNLNATLSEKFSLANSDKALSRRKAIIASRMKQISQAKTEKDEVLSSQNGVSSLDPQLNHRQNRSYSASNMNYKKGKSAVVPAVQTHVFRVSEAQDNLGEEENLFIDPILREMMAKRADISKLLHRKLKLKKGTTLKTRRAELKENSKCDEVDSEGTLQNRTIEDLESLYLARHQGKPFMNQDPLSLIVKKSLVGFHSDQDLNSISRHEFEVPSGGKHQLSTDNPFANSREQLSLSQSQAGLFQKNAAPICILRNSRYQGRQRVDSFCKIDSKKSFETNRNVSSGQQLAKENVGNNPSSLVNGVAVQIMDMRTFYRDMMKKKHSLSQYSRDRQNEKQNNKLNDSSFGSGERFPVNVFPKRNVSANHVSVKNFFTDQSKVLCSSYLLNS